MKASYKNTVYVCLGLLILLMLVFTWLGFTSSGLKFVLARVPQLMTSGGVTGSLLGRIQLDNVSYKNGGITLSASDLQLDWQPSALLNKKLALTNLEFTSFQGSSMVGEETASNPVQGVELPFDIVVERFAGTQLAWFQNNQQMASVDRINFSGEVIKSVLTINRLELKNSQDRAALSGELDLSLSNEGELKLGFSHQLSSLAGLTEPFIGSGKIEGTWSNLLVTHSSKPPYTLRTRVEFTNLLSEDPSWSIISSLDEFLLPIDNGSMVSGDISSAGTLDSSSLKGLLTVLSNEAQYQVSLDSAFQGDQFNLHKLSIKPADSSSGADHVMIRGSVNDMGSLLNQTSSASGFSLSGEWHSIEFLSAIAEINAPESSGVFSVDGDLNKYQFVIKSQTWTSQFEKCQLTLQGHGAPGKVTADSISVRGNDIDLEASAIVMLKNSIGTIELNGLNGELRNEPVSGNMRVTWSDGLIVVDQLEAVVAGTQVKAQGPIGQVSDLTWSLNTDDLTLLNQQASGTITADGHLTGDIKAPIIDVNLDIRDFVYKDMRMESLHGNIKFGLAPKSKWQGDLNLSNASIADKKWLADSRLTLSGTLEQHILEINSRFESAQYTTASWQGAYVNRTLSFTGVIDNIPLSVANPFILTLPFQLSGGVNARFNGSFQAGKALTIEGDLTSSELVFKSISGNEQDFVAQDFKVNLVADDNIRFDVSAVLADGGLLNGKLTLADSIISEFIADSKLDGELQIVYQDLSSLSALLSSATLSPTIKIGGLLKANARLDGFLKSPKVTLNAMLLDATFNLPEQGIALNNIDLDIRSLTANRFQVIGMASAGEGQVKLDGNIDLLNTDQVISNMSMVATDALFIDSPVIKAQGDADLVLTFEDNNLDISGRIVTDKADLKIGTAISAVSESPDIILQGLEPKIDATLLTMKLDLDLGNQTTISANGLTGRLVGKPTIRLDTNELFSSVGEVQVVDGKFTIIGKTLNIDKGIASYAGGAITNPQLSFKATKTIGNIRAGVSIQGNADAPQLSLFSEPALGDQDILALVFFEKPLDQLSSSDALKLVSIANTLRGGSSDFKIDAITDSVAEYLGVDKFDISLDSKNDQHKLSVSSKINSRLDIGYAYNFISSLQALFLRYKINDRWSIQSSVDVEGGADIKYKIETD